MKSNRSTNWLAASWLLGIALALGPAHAADVYLVAKPLDMTMPDSTVVPMWGLAVDADGDLSTDDGEAASVPGPPIDLEGDADLTIHLRNDLGSPVSIVIPGQEMPVSGCAATPTWTDGTAGPRGGDASKRVRSFGCEASPGGTQTYAWTAATSNPLKPGSYVYHSGTHPQVQVQMGLYGALRAKPASGVAYPGVTFDREVDLLFSEVDPALHAAIDAEAGGGGVSIPRATSTLSYHPRYFLINGEAQEAPGGALTCLAPAGGALAADEVVLLRLMNAGLKEHAPMLLGGRWTLVGDGGNPVAFPREQYSAFLQAGSSKDVTFSSASAGVFPILDRRLNLTNHLEGDGGMQTCLEIAAAAEAEPPLCGFGPELAVLMPVLFGLHMRRARRRAQT